MFDRSMPDIHLAMRAPTLEDIPAFAPPAPYRVRLFRPGEEESWARIEMTAGEFADMADAMRGFDRYFRADALLLPGRMLFMVDGDDAPVATTTAWFAGDVGMLHWVAVDAKHQGKGLARPMIGAALRRMRELGYVKAALGTQPASWVAIRLYLEFGFRPVWSDEERVIDGWKAVYEKLGREFHRELCEEPE